MATLSYRASLKNIDVEEIIDLAIHRPLGYLVARAAYATPISADALTVVSMLAGVAAAVAYAAPLWGGGDHNVLGSLLFIGSAVLDCSDGQLARMRQRTTRYGRMLDGAVDAVVQVTAVPAAGAVMIARMGGIGTPEGFVWTLLAIAAILCGIRHTTLYDHFKNVYVRNTDPTPRDCDDLAEIESEWQRIRSSKSTTVFTAMRFWMYRLHLSLVAQTMRWIDPNIPARFAEMPAYSAERAERYRTLSRGLMRAWTFFGIGTHIFLFALAAMFDRIEWYIVLRLVGFNLLLAMLVPLQRRASRAFFLGDDATTHDPAVTA